MLTRMLETVLPRLVTAGDLTLILPDGRRLAAGDGSSPRAVARIHGWGTLAALLLDPELALGEAYMDGRLTMEEGAIADLLEILMRSLGTGAAPTLLRPWRRATRLIAQWNAKGRASRNARHHYDIPGGIYDLFLDADRQYSCAYFTHKAATLEAAQAAKKRHILTKLCLRPGDRVLDIGCGWGGLALSLANAGAGHVTGITLAREQATLAQARVQDAGLNGQISICLNDYRTVEGPFDRIVSVGMLEHVGVAHLPTYFRQVSRLLTQDGVALIHFIVRTDGPGATNPWIARYIFPGGYTPALSEVLPAVERAGLILSDVEILRLHYAETLRHWRARFMAARSQALRIVDERFCRMWEFYLAGAEMGFRHQGLAVAQIQLIKRIDALPLTRDYMVDRERAHRLTPPVATDPVRRRAA